MPGALYNLTYDVPGSSLQNHQMKKTKLILLCLFLITGTYSLVAQQIAAPYQVATWQGFHNAAISYTFDDGCSNQLAKAVPMFDKYGFKLTLFTVTSWNPNWVKLQEAADEGHEIASHTVHHVKMGELDRTQQKNEIVNSIDAINSNINGYKCLTLAYPNCVTGNEKLVSEYFIAARGCQGYIEKSTPEDFMNVSSIICGSLGAIKTKADFVSQFESAAKSSGWCVLLLHGIDDDGGYSPLPSDELRSSLEYLQSKPDDFWVATFVDVSKYIKERNAANVVASDENKRKITLEVTDTLDNSIYNMPISIKRPLPDGWEKATVTQNGHQVKSRIISEKGISYLIFDVTPDNGKVILSKS